MQNELVEFFSPSLSLSLSLFLSLSFCLPKTTFIDYIGMSNWSLNAIVMTAGMWILSGLVSRVSVKFLFSPPITSLLFPNSTHFKPVSISISLDFNLNLRSPLGSPLDQDPLSRPQKFMRKEWLEFQIEALFSLVFIVPQPQLQIVTIAFVSVFN